MLVLIIAVIVCVVFCHALIKYKRIKKMGSWYVISYRNGELYRHTCPLRYLEMIILTISMASKGMSPRIEGSGDRGKMRELSEQLQAMENE